MRSRRISRDEYRPSRNVTLPFPFNDIETRGNKAAPVTMIEFSDYQCPFCKRHFQQTVPRLVKDYVDSGKVRYVFRDFPLAQIHPLATKAAAS